MYTDSRILELYVERDSEFLTDKTKIITGVQIGTVKDD